MVTGDQRHFSIFSGKIRIKSNGQENGQNVGLTLIFGLVIGF
jgi:hypothetical protein